MMPEMNKPCKDSVDYILCSECCFQGQCKEEEAGVQTDEQEEPRC